MNAHYCLFGLKVRSEIALNFEACAPFNHADVEIRIGEVPQVLEGATRYNALNSATPDQALLHMPGVARFLVERGACITVAPEPGIDSSSLAEFTAISPMAAILHQRGHICLHASAVARHDQCLLFMAPSGTGKSSLAAALQQRGWWLVTDDIAVIHPAPEGGWMVSAGPARLKLWPSTLTMLNIDPENLERVRNKLEKRVLRTLAPTQPVPLLKAISLLDADNLLEEIHAARRTGKDAIEALMANTYRWRMQATVGGKHGNFLRMTALAGQVPFFRLTRPAKGQTLQSLADTVEAIAASL